MNKINKKLPIHEGMIYVAPRGEVGIICEDRFSISTKNSVSPEEFVSIAFENGNIISKRDMLLLRLTRKL